MQPQKPPNGTKAGPFSIELEGLGSHGHLIAFRLGVRREGATTGLTAVALRAGVIEATLDDILILVAVWTIWMLHAAILTRLFPFRHSPAR
jgi:hypothetical protein